MRHARATGERGAGGRRIAARLATLAAFAAVSLLAVAAWARVGGGDSYGGGSYDHGGDGGDGAAVALIVRLLLRLLLEQPAVGVPLTVVAIIAFVVWSRRRGGVRPYATGGGGSPRRVLTLAAPPGLPSLRDADPSFSQPAFLDFVRLLYVRLQEARGTGKLEALRPYVGKTFFAQLENERRTLRPTLSDVEEVVVGAARIRGARVSGSRNSIEVELEANYTETSAAGSRRFYAHERWWLGRAAGVLSKAPEQLVALSCPSCGNAVELKPDGTCKSCGEVVTNGSFHWQLDAASIIAKHPPEPLSLRGSGGGREHGLDRPTLFHPAYAAEARRLLARYPSFSFADFEGRVRAAFVALNDAWASKQWDKARPYETDHLFDTHRYWIERYKASHLTNKVEKIEIIGVTPCKIEQDAFFEAITVRAHARMIDYTVRDADGAVVRGSANTPREFSEYWTFIRRSGFDASKKIAPDSCPSCAAPLKISMAGVCEYCGAHVTSGQFDWVLSAIDQDEDYAG